jgi:hypothetical protein
MQAVTAASRLCGLTALALALASPAGLAAGKPMTGEQVRALITGNTVTGPLFAKPYEFSYTPEGRVYGTIGASTGNGTWRIREGDRYCHLWSVFFSGTEHCYRWHDLGGGRYRMVNVDAFRDRDVDVWSIRPGLD